MFLDKAKIEEIERIEDHNAKMFAAAAMYVAEGFAILPLRPGTKILPSRDSGITSHNNATRSPSKVEAWYGSGGKFEGWNIGLACGREDGLFVLDVDVKGDKDGIKSFHSFLGALPESDPCAVTPSGGLHFLYKWWPNGGTTVEKIGPGLDTRGGTAQKYRSHVAAWPSVTPEGVYSWQIFGEVPDAPKWLTDAMGVPAPQSLGRGNENIEHSDLDRVLSSADITTALSYIDPNKLNYEEWLVIGQAINSQIPGQEGLNLWDEWSKQGDRYERGECHKRWKGFNPGGSIRGGTLIHFAKQYGFVPPENIVTSTGPLLNMIDELNQTFAVVMTGGKVRILAEIKDGNPYSPSHQLMTKEDFGLLLANQKVLAPDARGNIKATPKSQIWLADENRRSFPGGITFSPGNPKEFDGMYNLWEGFQLEPEPGSCDLIYQHILNIVCSGNREHYEWLLDWIADCIQDPANPKGCAVVMRGPEGAGKGTLGQMFARIFGIHYKHVVHERHLTGNFNSHLANAVVVFADEVLYGGQKKIAGAIKSLVTEKQLTIERKGLDADSYQNCCHLLIASNEDWFIPAGPQSRRWFVLDVSGAVASNKKYFDALHAEIQGPGLQAFLRDMLDRRIEHNLTKAPETDLLMEQRGMASSGDPIIAWWTGVLETEKIGAIGIDNDIHAVWPEAVDRYDCYRTFSDWALSHGYRYNQGSNHFYKKMETLGVKSARLSIDGKRKWALKFPSVKKCKDKLYKASGIKLEEGDE